MLMLEREANYYTPTWLLSGVASSLIGELFHKTSSPDTTYASVRKVASLRVGNRGKSWASSRDLATITRACGATLGQTT